MDNREAILVEPDEIIYCPACGGQVAGPEAFGHEADCELQNVPPSSSPQETRLADDLVARSDRGPGDHFEGEFFVAEDPEKPAFLRPMTPDEMIEGRNEIVQVGKSDLAISADHQIEQFREMERIKASLLRDANDWHTIEGRMVPSAQGANKLIPPFGISFQIISTNEHGTVGVRRERTSWIDYETETIVKKMPGRNGGTYNKSMEVRTGNYKELPQDLYTVTVRATDRWGRFIDMDGSVSSLEEKHAQSDHKMRSIAQTRAEKRALIRLVGGVDANFMDDDDARRAQTASKNAASAKKVSDRPRQYGLRPLYDRAKALNLCRDRASFFAFVSNNVPGCESCINGIVTPNQTVAIHEYLLNQER